MYTLEVFEDQIDRIVTSELKACIEAVLLNDDAFGESDVDYKMLSHLFPVLNYFSTRNDFTNFVESIEKTFPDFKYSELDSKV